MKKIVLAIVMIFTLSACGSQVDYTRDTGSGEIIEVSYEDFLEMMNAKETFYVVFSQTNCGSCIVYKEDTLLPYLENHGMQVYEVNITNEEDPTATFENMDERFEKFEGTPHNMFIQDGEVSDEYVGGLEEKILDEYVVKYQLDEKN